MKPLAQNTLIQNRYLIVQLIGKGGMGEVYLAVDQRLGSAVALKRTFFAGDEMLSSAFEREARILARMRHPVLPKVSDHFSEGDEQYLVMEHISGDDLAKRLEAAQKPFPLSWVMFWADQLLDALSYLHSHEPPIIHRDIKPQNLKLTDENHVILLDFGLSKNTAAVSAPSGDSGNSGNSSSSASVVGYTPHYAPMEQIRGIGTNPKSDIYSLSATLYQLLTNVVPPDALSRADSMLNSSPDPIQPPNEINSEVPAGVGSVILHGMEVSQEKRYDNAREMQKALRKAHAQMQEAMSAHTVVMSAEGTSQSDSVPVGVPSMDKTEVMDFAGMAALSVPTAIAAAEGSTNLANDPGPAPFDPNATIAYDPNGNPSAPLQSDVKTEVFIAGSNSFPTPPVQDQVLDDSAVQIAASDFSEDFGDHSENDGEYGSENVAFAPDATMPVVSFNEFSDSPGAESSSWPGNGETSGAYGSESASTAGAAAFAGNESVGAVVQSPAKKGSGGKIFAVVAGLFVLFGLGALAIGGGLYYYNNYYAAEVEPEASPSPMPTVEPTPEPTIDYAASNESNSNTEMGSTSDSNSNVNSSADDDLTVGPTPAPSTSSTQTQPVAGRQTPPATTSKKDTARSPGSPPSKATPKPTSTRDRKVILQ